MSMQVFSVSKFLARELGVPANRLGECSEIQHLILSQMAVRFCKAYKTSDFLGCDFVLCWVSLRATQVT